MKPVTTKEELLIAVRSAILESGKSTRTIAGETGISKSHIHNISSNSVSNITLEVLMDLADHLEIPYLFQNRSSKK